MNASPVSTIQIPATEMLTLASRALQNLYLAQEEEHARLVSLGPEYEDKADAVIEDISDTSLSFCSIDPASYYRERQRLGSWVGKMPEGADQFIKRLKALLQIGSCPKAQYVIPEAVAKLRADEAQTGAQQEDQGKRNALLDLLVFLSGSRNRASLLQVVEEGGD